MQKKKFQIQWNSRRLVAQKVRSTFAVSGSDAPVLSIQSFGFARGIPRNADLVFDMRFLRNPHWDPVLRPGTGLDADVSAYVAADPAYPAAMAQIGSSAARARPRGTSARASSSTCSPLLGITVPK